MFFRLCLTLLLLFAPQAHARPGLHTEITVRQLGATEWEASYRFSEPVTEAIFRRNTNLFRRENWNVVTDGLTIIEQEKSEKLVSENGKIFSSATVRFRSYSAQLTKDYNFFVPFTDGGQILFTGHLNVGGQTNFVFESPGSHIYFLGNGFYERAEWHDSDPGGTYVYFGNTQPLKADLFIGIID